MSVRVSRAVLFVLLWLLMPAAAQAQIGRGWLERLSGPGPFRGFPILEFKPLCIGRTLTDGDRRSADEVLEQHPGLRRFIRPMGEPPTVWATAVGCHFLPPDKPRIEIGFQFSPLHSGANALDYTERTIDGVLPDTRINLRTYLVTADIRVTRLLDVGAAVGWGTFSSRGDLFPTFTRGIGVPLRLTTRPLAVLWDSRRADALLIQFDGTRFAGGFTDADFGADPGTYDEPGEMLWTWSIKADLTALLWR